VTRPEDRATSADTPRTNPHDRSAVLPAAWEPGAVESELYQRWVDAGWFTADATSSKPSFSIVLPPPNVTGSLHLGHALDHTLMDAMTRRKRMQGYEVLWLPGTDHAGIATQAVVEKRLEGTTRQELGREAFVEKVWDWTKISGDTVRGQMRRLGDGVDWSRERFTLDDGLSRGVQTIFQRLFDAGLVYRAERLVNWSPALQSAISDIEVSFRDVEGELVSLRYGSLDDTEPHVVVATTRVETMLGDTAVAVHPDDERYAHLVGTTLEHPLTGRRIPVIADDYVDPEFGTGAVKITPAHDPNDFEMGRRHGLEMPSIMDVEGRITGTGTEFDGMDRSVARVAVREALAAQGRVVKEVRPYLHSVGHSERTGEPIEPRLSLQWFVATETLAKAAGDAVRDGRTTIHPKSQEPRWFAWVDNMHDWCISRQLWWGHRIPIWYGPDGETVCVGPDDVPPSGEGWHQDPDVLDTWFSSGQWPFATLGWPEQTPELARFYPTDVLVTGYDILFFWVARMMMFGLYVAEADGRAPVDAVPFTDVFLHGLLRDGEGRKMSKSRGNGIDPIEWMDTFGADAVRFTLARGANPGADLSVGDEHAQASRNFVTKLFNATKLGLMNGAEVDGLPDRADLTDVDRWVLDRLDVVLAENDALLDRFEIGKASELVFHFAWDEVFDWYLELAKVQLGREGDEPTAPATRAVLGHVLDVLLRLLHPTMPFVTETLWTALTGRESVVVASWPTHSGASADTVAARRVADLQRLVTEVRRFRADQGLRPTQKVAARLTGLSGADLDPVAAQLLSLARLDEPGEGFAATASIEVRLSRATVQVELDTSGTVDLAAERRRLDKELAAAEKELATTTGKLGSAAFVGKAPDDVVAKIRARQSLATEEIERVTARLAGLGQG
jgi:valyl-tRNA synthetase